MALSLASLKTTASTLPPRIFIYAVHGIGKTTFGSGRDAITRVPTPGHNPAFIITEAGADAVGVQAFPLATKYEDVLEAIGVLYQEEHNYNAVVLDTADWLEQLIHRKVATEWKVTSIDKIDYGKGFKAAAEYMKTVLDGLDVLRNERGMMVIMLGHSKTKRFDDPLTEAYDRYMPDMHDGTSSLIAEWCDIMLFGNYRTVVMKQDVGFGQKHAYAVGGGDRMLYSQERPGWTAKSRWPLPYEMPFHFATFQNHLIAAMSNNGAPIQPEPAAEAPAAA